jgi:hypothetical protein
MSSLREVHLASAAFVVASAMAVAACLGSPESEPGTGTDRVNSAERFSGDKRQVAAALERFEAAVLAGDVTAICEDSLRIRGDHGNDDDNGGMRFCTSDPVNSPSALIERAGGESEYDVVVRDVTLVRWKDRLRKAVADLSIGASRETAVLRPGPDGWQIVTRAATHALATDPHSCERDLKVREPLPSRSATLRAALQGPFVRGTRPEDLVLGSVTYRPDYHHIYAAVGGDARVRWMFPVGVWGAGSFDASSVYVCRKGGGVFIIS